MKALDLIDKVYVINLPLRKDRRTTWETLLEYLPLLKERIEFFPAVDGSLIENKTRLRNGELGCSLSHLKIWRIAREHGYRFILVFEDDVVFGGDFEQSLKRILEELGTEFDWLYLYNTWDYRPVEQYSKLLHKVVASLGTQAYIMNLNSLFRLEPFVKEFNFPIDVVMGHMSFLSDVYRPVNIFIQHNEDSPSNVSEIKSYDGLFHRTLKHLLKFIR